jgi:hypothetical protein
MAAFLFRLETVEGEPADPPTLSTVVYTWRAVDAFFSSREQNCHNVGMAFADRSVSGHTVRA